MSSTRGSESTLSTTRSVPGLFSQFGIVPDVVQILAPDAYRRNEEHERALEGGGCKPTRYPDDPLYPPHADSDCLAMTPVYRNGQKRWFEIIDAYSNHGPFGPGNNASSPPVWHEWDGTTIFPAYSLNSLTPEEKIQYRKDWYKWVFPGFPNDFIIRGLKQLYDTVQPFQDESKPTVREFELWNDKVLNHFRYISGLPPAYMSQSLFIMCQWTFERKTTNIWDAYGGTIDSAYGPCYLPPSGNLHCGTTFKPVYVDQKPYNNEYYCNYPCGKDPPEVTLNQATEAITVWYNGNAFSAMSRNLRKLFEGSGTTGAVIGGHAGPYAGRSLYGLAVGRAKFAGSSFTPPSGYSY